MTTRVRCPALAPAWIGAALLAVAMPPASGADRVWVGPMPFIEGRTLRADYFSTLTDPAQWPTVLRRTNVLKSYIMVLPEAPVPGKTEPELTDSQLRTLARFVRRHRLKVAFEVGGLRTSPEICGETAGERYAASELVHLRRWLRAGGRIDYLTTDHAVMLHLSQIYRPDMHAGTPAPARAMSLAELCGEVADYFLTMHRAIPGARFGCIESLGFFHVRGPAGKEYAATDPRLPTIWFHDYLDTLLAAMRTRGLTLDHFHIDFGYEGVAFDGRAEGRLDFGRVLGVESYARSRRVKAGVIVNAFHDQSAPSPAPSVASREAYNRTLRFYREYVAAGGRADHLVIQTWQPYPDRTGPEDEPGTVLNIARDILAR